MGKRGAGDSKKKNRIQFLTYGRNEVATYGGNGCWGLEKEQKELNFWHMGEMGSPHMGKRGVGDYLDHRERKFREFHDDERR